VLKAMAKQPHARYQTAAAMRADLLRAGATSTLPLPAARGPRAGDRERSGPVRSRGPGRRRRAALALAVLVLGGLAATALPRLVGGGPQPEPDQAAAPPERPVMPRLRGLTVAAARARLHALGVERPVTVRHQFDGTVAEGRLIATDPPEGSRLLPGTRISFVVSDGPRSEPASEGDKDDEKDKKDDDGNNKHEKDRKDEKEKGGGGKE
jgi:hypothetical protein